MATCPSCGKHFPDEVVACDADGATLLPDAALKNVDRELRPGERVDDYVIEAKLGAGAFGTVYRATHAVIGKSAAIKVLQRVLSAHPQMVSRFVEEARAVNRIEHPGIVDIFDFGVLEDGRQFYVMELLRGQSYTEFLREQGPVPIETALPLLRRIARALDAAHAHGIIHRDLKPDNVFLVDAEEGWTPKLLDFGIAKLTGDADLGHKTRTGMPMGTPAYMSPQQCRGEPVDHRSDVYAFGVVVHETLTGRRPFVGQGAADLLVQHLSTAAPPMSSHHPSVPPALDAVVLRMLAKDPADRHDSVGAAVDALEQAAPTTAPAGAAVPATSTPAGPASHPAPLPSTPTHAGDAVSSSPAAPAGAATAAGEPAGDPILTSASGASASTTTPEDATASPPSAATAGPPPTEAGAPATQVAPVAVASTPSTTLVSGAPSAPAPSRPSKTMIGAVAAVAALAVIGAIAFTQRSGDTLPAASGHASSGASPSAPAPATAAAGPATAAAAARAADGIRIGRAVPPSGSEHRLTRRFVADAKAGGSDMQVIRLVDRRATVLAGGAQTVERLRIEFLDAYEAVKEGTQEPKHVRDPQHGKSYEMTVTASGVQVRDPAGEDVPAEEAERARWESSDILDALFAKMIPERPLKFGEEIHPQGDSVRRMLADHSISIVEKATLRLEGPVGDGDRMRFAVDIELRFTVGNGYVKVTLAGPLVLETETGWPLHLDLTSRNVEVHGQIPLQIHRIQLQSSWVHG